MGWTVAILLFALWVLGLVSGAALGWWVHILLVMSLVSLVMALVRRGAQVE
jgi:hypothetical protein